MTSQDKISILLIGLGSVLISLGFLPILKWYAILYIAFGIFIIALVLYQLQEKTKQ